MASEANTPLSSYFASIAAARLPLKDAIRRRLDIVIAHLDDDGRIAVSELHELLYPELPVRSANTSLRRFIKAVNDAAAQGGLGLTMAITEDRYPGADGRYVWFEGPPPSPRPATRELDRIGPESLIIGTRGVATDDLPVVVLLTFNQHETTALLRAFNAPQPPPRETRDTVTYNLLGRYGVHGGHRLVHRVCDQGQASSQAAATEAYHAWNPAAVIAVGIAFGASPRTQNIGDVLVAEAAYPYERTRQSPGGVTVPRGIPRPASETLLARVRHIDQTRRAAPVSATRWPDIHTGVILSGNKLVDDSDFKKQLATLWPDSVGGEMEGYGLAFAAERRGFDWALIKAICDWGDGTKDNPHKERDQRLAATNAAQVLYEVLGSGPLWNPSRNPSREPSRTPPLPQGPNTFPDLAGVGGSMIPLKAVEVSMEKSRDGRAPTRYDAPLAAEPRQDGVDAVDTLIQWADAEAAPPVFAVLGEYGMGKTITCQRLATSLYERREQDRTRRPALYFDLRSVTGLDRRVPTLDQILVECMSRDWPRADTAQFTAMQIYRWLDAGAVIIFDGLDEALVKMSARDGQTFTRTLLGIVDIAAERPGCPPPRVVISCRTQYFRTLRDQQNHFTGYERRNTGAEQFRALTLLPLTGDQIEGYLRVALPGQDPDQLRGTIRSVHNLPELAQRPFTLALIADHIPDLEAARAAGRQVFGVTLYRSMVTRWLERDEGKHHIRPEHKMLLAEHLAAHLWRERTGSLSAGDLEDWFHLWRGGSKALTARYQNLPVDQLEEDLRTATFLARVDEPGGGGFRFAHTSLQEFFLSEYLVRAVYDDVPERWAIPAPSRETFGFLAQSLAERDDGALLRTRIGTWGRVRRADVNENILTLALAAHTAGVPGPSLAGLDLSGAEISDLVIDGRGSGWLDLSGAKLTGARARRVMVAGVDLSGADFSGAVLTQAEFLDCRGEGGCPVFGVTGVLCTTGFRRPACGRRR